ncbi:hybrid-cluster NAD(P)-dependent oxidoreductase [Brevibacterium sp.]|uniref:hybrid-cluster NAD(P)-dependent oxidoreductase n=1 Tax=Brevibacterium sp. TaxID=1701 RepID=UPI002810B74F|nr:hybrid-cluster NAD(P)-dependent oxidoreductase [Brevibacterium sp.]
MEYRRSTLPTAVKEPESKFTFRVPNRRSRTGSLPTPAEVIEAAVSETALAQPAPAASRALAYAGPARAEASAAPARAESSALDELTGFVDVVGITQVTHDVRTFELRAGWLGSVDFEPGQYVTMCVPELGLERCYSISSAPFGTNTFTITVKRVPGGVVSNHLHDAVKVGSRLHVDGPYGLFSTSFHPASTHLFVCAGSGITPIMSMVRSLLADPEQNSVDIVVVHNAATPDDIIFRAELEQLDEVQGVSVVTMCSRGSAARSGRRGRISAEVLAEVVPALREREVFVCGPAGYMATVRAILDELGVPGPQVHEESFVFGKSPKERLMARSSGPGSHERASEGRLAGTAAGCNPLARFGIEFRNSGMRTECDGATTVLDAALQAGIAAPSSCEEGACGTCKSLLVSGKVDMRHAGGIRPKEIAAGKFLPCCSTPLSDLVVE